MEWVLLCGLLKVMFCFLGRGHFIYRGQVEDSATAEISRSQVGLGLHDPTSAPIPVGHNKDKHLYLEELDDNFFESHSV